MTAGTPYEGGLFKMKLVLPKEFPSSPPLGTCNQLIRESVCVCVKLHKRVILYFTNDSYRRENCKTLAIALTVILPVDYRY